MEQALKSFDGPHVLFADVVFLLLLFLLGEINVEACYFMILCKKMQLKAVEPSLCNNIHNTTDWLQLQHHKAGKSSSSSEVLLLLTDFIFVSYHIIILQVVLLPRDIKSTSFNSYSLCWVI